jgi:cytochrome c553
MLPPPPELPPRIRESTPERLFYVVKHGMKFTGMPAWPSQHRDDEVWAMVAFLKRLPDLNAEGYRALALGGLTLEPPSGREIATADATSAATNACMRCHGAAGQGPSSELVPVLHGQPAPFLVAALEAYASARRASGIMQPVAVDLTPRGMERVADFYSGLARPPDTARANVDAAAVERGRAIALEGVASDRIPPCSVCHGADALPAYPRLAGQNFRYMIGRLHRWQEGLVADTATAAIMAPIARLLTEQQSADVSAYFSALQAGSAGGATQR